MESSLAKDLVVASNPSNDPKVQPTSPVPERHERIMLLVPCLVVCGRNRTFALIHAVLPKPTHRIPDVETDQAIEEPAEIMHINQDSENKGEAGERDINKWMEEDGETAEFLTDDNIAAAVTQEPMEEEGSDDETQCIRRTWCHMQTKPHPALLGATARHYTS
ncbi:hypothetical protein TNCV_3171211 [Trichonephila clavipes]|nr:hypothetical protein TNCV_3171211 [Trichonephila clavipes]